MTGTPWFTPDRHEVWRLTRAYVGDPAPGNHQSWLHPPSQLNLAIQPDFTETYNALIKCSRPSLVSAPPHGPEYEDDGLSSDEADGQEGEASDDEDEIEPKSSALDESNVFTPQAQSSSPNLTPTPSPTAASLPPTQQGRHFLPSIPKILARRPVRCTGTPCSRFIVLRTSPDYGTELVLETQSARNGTPFPGGALAMQLLHLPRHPPLHFQEEASDGTVRMCGSPCSPATATANASVPTTTTTTTTTPSAPPPSSALLRRSLGRDSENVRFPLLPHHCHCQRIRANHHHHRSPMHQLLHLPRRPPLHFQEEALDGTVRTCSSPCSLATATANVSVPTTTTTTTARPCTNSSICPTALLCTFKKKPWMER
ncbi:hypothetical protein F5888DRAFT_1636520 [Russula emetica]|nr:hypothetical protein F5888DRAFT_1636520 [Russula emetica]